MAHFIITNPDGTQLGETHDTLDAAVATASEVTKVDSVERVIYQLRVMKRVKIVMVPTLKVFDEVDGE